VSHGPRTSASHLRGRKPLHTRPDTAPITIANPSPFFATHRAARRWNSSPPRAKVLRPSLYELRVASLRLPPHLRTVDKPHSRRCVTSSCCVGRSLSLPLHRRDAGAEHPVTMPRASPLLPPPLLAPRAAPSSLQLPSPMPRGHHQPPCPAHLLATDVRTKIPSASPPR
jgi:hypothetical protein